MQCGALLALLSVACAAAGEDSGVVADPRGPVGIERGIARVLCARGVPTTWTRSRAVVVDTGIPRAVDFVVAPGHVLPRDVNRVVEDCHVVGAGGVETRIATFLLPAEFGSSLSADWVVLVTAARLEGEVGRLRIDALAQAELEQMLRSRAPLRLMLHSRSAEQDDCRFAAEHWNVREIETGLFTHSCRTWDGTSGAPIAIEVDGAPIVVAINIGRRLELSPGSSRRYVGLGLAIDEDLTEAVREAADRFSTPSEQAATIAPRRRRDRN